MVNLNKNIPIGSTTWGTLVNDNWQTIENSLNSASSRGVKDPCRAATTANITLSAPQTIDGVACIAGDRVLVRAQTTQSQNGIYVVQAAAWTRATDADQSQELGPGTLVHVNEGILYSGTIWRFAGTGTYTIGTTAILVRPLNLPTYGTIRGVVEVSPYSSGIQKLATGLTTASGGMITAGTARWTVGLPGTYRIRVRVADAKDSGTPTADIYTFHVYKNNAFIRSIVTDKYPVEVSYNVAVGIDTGRIDWEEYLYLVESDYIEFFARDSSNGPGHLVLLNATIERLVS